MDWTASIDDYCERTSPALWSEPLNIATNAAFLVAAVFAFVRYRRCGVRDRRIEAMIVLLVVIAAGSAVFHSVATRWAMVADVAPIGVLVVVYLAYFLRVVLGFGRRRVALWLAAFLAASGAASLIPRAWFNNSQSYLATLVTMAVIAAATWPTVGRRVAVAAAVFAVSLTLRSVDLAVCGAVPSGTHFLWHALNGVLLAILMSIVIDERARLRMELGP